RPRPRTPLPHRTTEAGPRRPRRRLHGPRLRTPPILDRSTPHRRSRRPRRPHRPRQRHPPLPLAPPLDPQHPPPHHPPPRAVPPRPTRKRPPPPTHRTTRPRLDPPRHQIPSRPPPPHHHRLTQRHTSQRRAPDHRAILRVPQRSHARPPAYSQKAVSAGDFIE